MGGGMGIAAGADMVLATERTQIAMPETRIGFFPDVGATGWMFSKCPSGYPEFLALTGYESTGAECVRVGLASHLISRPRLPELLQIFERSSGDLSSEKPVAVSQLLSLSKSLTQTAVAPKPELDEWVRTYFSGRTSLVDIMTSLSECTLQVRQCEGVFQRLSERSPTALVLTLLLLRHNEGRTVQEALQADLKAARFIFKHPDYLEGVRARLLDKDDHPQWRPDSIEKVGPLDVKL
jgi:enoyl-CoA hydratase/carnithine racemase